MRTVIVFAGCCLMCASLAKADECDAIIGNLVARVPGLTLDKRTPVKGSSDIVSLKHPGAKELSIFCPVPGVPYPILNDDWTEGLPPPGYFQLLAQIGNAITGVPADAIRAAALKCQKIALASQDELGDLESEGIKYECSAFTRDGGGTTISLAKHESEK